MKRHEAVGVKSFRSVVGSDVRFSFSPHAPCPCGGKESASRCCLTPTGFRKTPALSSPRPPKTGESREWCYSNCLSDCDDKRSQEHFISGALLEYLNQQENLRVSGFPWLRGEERALPPNALKSGVLCKRHNSALSPLDSIAVRLFNAFDERQTPEHEHALYLFCGHDIERWLLKILCGLASSGNLALDGECDTSIPEYWLRILFGEAEFPDEQGLYVCKSRGHRFVGPRGVALRAVTGRGRLTGIGLWVCGYELILSMSGFHSRTFDGREMAYRPLELHTTGRNFEKSILLSWNGSADLGTISVHFGGN